MPFEHQGVTYTIEDIDVDDVTREHLPVVRDSRLLEIYVMGGTLEGGRVVTLDEVLALAREAIVSRRVADLFLAHADKRR